MIFPSIEPHWLWLIAAAVLGILELLVPGVFMIWISLAALVTGALAWLLPIGVPAQWLVFAVATVASIYVGRRVLRRHPIVSSDPLLNERAARLVGTIVTAVQPIDEAGGRVRVGDGVWPARGSSAAMGDRLRITGLDGQVLLVEPLSRTSPRPGAEATPDL